jgi:hypothetical protein
MRPQAGINAPVLIEALPHRGLARGIFYICVEDNNHDP